MGPTTASNSKPRRRHRRTPIAALLALCSFAAGVQALAPASAGAAANQTTDCTRAAIPGLGFVENLGVNSQGQPCYLDGSGTVYEVDGFLKKKESTPNQPACSNARGCLPGQHAGPAGSGGSSGSDEAHGTKTGGAKQPAQNLESRLRKLAALWVCPSLDTRLKKLDYGAVLDWYRDHVGELTGELGGNPFRDPKEIEADEEMRRKVGKVRAALEKWGDYQCNGVLPEANVRPWPNP
jgi:hypothetical protein